MVTISKMKHLGSFKDNPPFLTADKINIKQNQSKISITKQIVQAIQNINKMKRHELELCSQ
jgi:hypothetical protein